MCLCCDNHLDCKVTREIAAAVLQLLFQVDQVPIRLKFVSNDQLLSPCFFLVGLQDAIANHQSKELVLDNVSLPYLQEDLFDGKKPHSGGDQNVREI